MAKADQTAPEIIKSRFQKMAEGEIPQEALEGLSESDVKTFLSEPDPDKWPARIVHLKKYVRGDTIA